MPRNQGGGGICVFSDVVVGDANALMIDSDPDLWLAPGPCISRCPWYVTPEIPMIGLVLCGVETPRGEGMTGRGACAVEV